MVDFDNLLGKLAGAGGTPWLLPFLASTWRTGTNTLSMLVTDNKHTLKDQA